MDSWRVFRIVSEFVDGFENLTALGPCVSMFGSARLKPDNPYYQMSVQTAKSIAEKGFAIITGGGPGIMEAGNKGAQLGEGPSCGLNIDLPFEVSSNAYVDPRLNLNFRYFFVRKVMFIRYAQAFVVCPGGFGTLDELFEALTLIQTEKIHPFPIYLMGKKYWSGLIDWIQDTMLSEGCISPKDMDLITITDDPLEVANGIEEHFKIERSFENF
ncbi:MAG: TIGR00730 family Rossman fold protein [Waddliaceae bacterium]|nr:TIGR00730 family Rossman fold protein [Waddliaceae bacterium]